MKKSVVIVVCLVILGVLLLGGIIFDKLKVIEKPHEGVDYSVQDIVKAYNLKEEDDKIILTIYGDRLRQVTIFSFDNEKLNDIKVQRYYSTKMEAKLAMKEGINNIENAVLKSNTITGDSKDKSLLGNSKQEILSKLKETYKNFKML